MTVISVIAHETIPKRTGKETRETNCISRGSARILRRVLKCSRDLPSLWFQWRLRFSTGEKIHTEYNTWTLPESQNKQRNIRVTVISIVVGALGTVPKCLEKRFEKLKIRGRIEAIQTTWLIRWASEGYWKPEENCCYSDSSESLWVDSGMKKTQGVKW